LDSYHDAIYNNNDEFEDASESEYESGDNNESEQSNDEENDKSDDENVNDAVVIDEEADLETLNNNDDIDLNDMPFDESEDQIDETDDETNSKLKEVLKEISGLLSKVRSIVRLSRKSNIIQIKMKELIKRYGLEKVNFIIDFHVRWNSSFLMIRRFKKLKEVVQAITNSTIQDIDGLTKPQYKKLQSWSLNGEEWQTLEMLENILSPFFSATKLLSGRKYPTLSLNLYVYRNLKHFLTNNFIKNPKSKENFIKEYLLDVLTYHFDTKISSEQMIISLVSKLLTVK
jgi:hypothetical protein